MARMLPWILQVLLILAGVFFLCFGIFLLLAAYQLNDPMSFIMTFFASNLIILISAALLVGFVWRMFTMRKDAEPGSE